MSWNSAYEVKIGCSTRYAGDKFQRSGEDLILEAALVAIEKHKSLSAGQAEAFASSSR